MPHYLLLTIALLAPLLALPLPALGQATADPERIKTRIDTLATFGGTPDGGTSRPGFSKADKQAREWLIGELTKLGLGIRVDAAGNLIATRTGADPQLPAIGFGSHIDSVPNGGSYDGQAGVVAAMEVMSMLDDQGVTTRHPLELIVFVAEEDGLFGSAAMIGKLSADELRFVIVPGRVDLTLEMRDLEPAPIDNAFARIREHADTIARAGDVEITIQHALSHTAAPTDPRVQAAIKAATDALGYSSMTMPSGAGHDAQNMASRWPTGMIFVPSRDGVSHSPREYTSAEGLAKGSEVLYGAVLALSE